MADSKGEPEDVSRSEHVGVHDGGGREGAVEAGASGSGAQAGIEPYTGTGAGTDVGTGTEPDIEAGEGPDGDARDGDAPDGHATDVQDQPGEVLVGEVPAGEVPAGEGPPGTDPQHEDVHPEDVHPEDVHPEDAVVAAGDPVGGRDEPAQGAPDGLPDAVRALLAEIAHIGRDERSGGYRRLAWTAEDGALAEWFAAACQARGLSVTRDRCGNQWAWWEPADPDTGEAGPGSAVVTGSHLDSVPGGGALDGPLGVAGALLAVDLLREDGYEPRRPIGLVRFADEEGARFGLPCAGSRLLTGAVEPQQVLVLTDDEGVRYADALRAAGVDPDGVGPDPELVGRIGTFVELHIEQGYGLAGVDAAVGAGRVIRPHGRWRADLEGRADHAGTALLSERNDPMLELARLVQTVRSTAARQDALATVGKVEVVPNAVNAVPSGVAAWVDVRADTPGQVRGVVQELQLSGFDLVEESWTPATVFDDAVTAQAAKSAAVALGLQESLPGLATGAGHDAGVLASAGVPATMLFVRNPTGVSHSPQETAAWEDCAAGVRALAAVLADLSG